MVTVFDAKAVTTTFIYIRADLPSIDSTLKQIHSCNKGANIHTRAGARETLTLQ